jgi:hypothetical protein
MPIAATVKYSLALSLMVALLVQFLLSRSWPLGSAASVRAGCDSAQSLSPRNKPRRASRSIPAHADGTGSPHPALPKARGKALERTEEAKRKTLSIAAAGALLIATTVLGYAQSSSQRTPDRTPGHKMQERGSVRGHPGASGYSPGHQMQRKGSRAGEPGASGYAPGHQPSTTGRGSMGTAR